MLVMAPPPADVLAPVPSQRTYPTREYHTGMNLAPLQAPDRRYHTPPAEEKHSILPQDVTKTVDEAEASSHVFTT